MTTTIKSFDDLKGLIPKGSDRVTLECLDDQAGVTKAILHFTTPKKDSDEYMDVSCYKVRNYTEEGTPNLVQYVFKMSTKEDGSFTISFTDSPVHGKDQVDLEILYSLYPYIYNLTPEMLTIRQKVVVAEGSEIH